jgi:hypothetical protein
MPAAADSGSGSRDHARLTASVLTSTIGAGSLLE